VILNSKVEWVLYSRIQFKYKHTNSIYARVHKLNLFIRAWVHFIYDDTYFWALIFQITFTTSKLNLYNKYKYKDNFGIINKFLIKFGCNCEMWLEKTMYVWSLRPSCVRFLFLM
jgi:hypothetical protein